MASILIASDLRDEFVTTNLPQLLSKAGHSTETIHPLEQVLRSVRMVAIANGSVELAIFVHSTSSISVGEDSPYRVAKCLRAIQDQLSFRNAVKAKSLPVLVIGKDVAELADEITGLRALRWVGFHDLAAPNDQIPIAVQDVIFRWREDLLTELEYAGYAVTIDHTDCLSVLPAFVKSEIEGEILAKHTDLGRLQESGYVIVSNDLFRNARSYRQFAYLIENFREIAKAKKTKPEEVFQSFFTENPHFLFREQFAEFWPKPRFHLPEDSSQWIEPDYVVKPAVGHHVGSKWRIVDLKLPDARLTTSHTFHPTFSQKLMKSLTQLANYRKYFGRVDVGPQLLPKLGFHPRNPRLAVLIGRKASPEIATVLDNAFDSTQMLNVEIITYEEVLEFQSLRLANDLAWLKRFK